MINKNLRWIATWMITDRCNLCCSYCDPTVMKRACVAEEIDRFAVLERIAAHKPRILNISGGEPSLVKELPKILSRAKEMWNPSIRVVHNGTAPQKLIDSFPYIDRLVISIDGPGNINAATRGISGDTVLESIAELFIAVGKNQIDGLPIININTVVTENNIDVLPAFAAQAASVSPSIVLSLLPVMPIDCELSILKNGEDGYRKFLDTYEKMKSVHTNIAHNFDCVMRHDDIRKIQCYNQYFTIKFSPCGEHFTCGSGIVSQFRRTDGLFKRVFKKGGIKKLFTIIARSVNEKMGKVDFTCRNMCNCESWLDMLFLGKDTGYAPITLRGLRGRLGDDDYMELEKFVKDNINPDFDVYWFKRLVDGHGL